MRYIKRYEKPKILETKQKEWTDKFIESQATRPDNSKYGHKDIKDLLFTMSHNKCFYCETILKGTVSEIDHYIEISENKQLAYEWENLYLSCENCNNKISNKNITVTETLNPCIDSDSEIEKHIYFEDELITFLTEKGELTIKKYKLSSTNLDYLRLKELQRFKNILLDFKNKQISESRKSLIKKEIEILKRFIRPDNSFSLMFKNILAKHKII